MFGAGLLMTPIAAAATSGVAMGEQGIVSGLLNTSRQLGGALGLTILATAAADRISARTAAGATAGRALSSGYSLAFLIGAAFLAMGTCLIVAAADPGGEAGVMPLRALHTGVRGYEFGEYEGLPGRDLPGRDRRYSQPFWRAARTASMRLRVPVLPMAADR